MNNKIATGLAGIVMLSFLAADADARDISRRDDIYVKLNCSCVCYKKPEDKPFKSGGSPGGGYYGDYKHDMKNCSCECYEKREDPKPLLPPKFKSEKLSILNPMHYAVSLPPAFKVKEKQDNNSDSLNGVESKLDNMLIVMKDYSSYMKQAQEDNLKAKHQPIRPPYEPNSKFKPADSCQDLKKYCNNGDKDSCNQYYKKCSAGSSGRDNHRHGKYR